MKNLFLIILLFIFGYSTTYCQEKNEYLKFDNFKIDSALTNSLKSLNFTNEEKKKTINKVKDYYSYYEQSEWAIEEKLLVDNFTFLELNGDGKPDLIFQGWSGGESNCIKIHLSNDNEFVSPIVFYQELKDIKIENGIIKSLIAVNRGCCAEYVEQETTYSFDKNFNSKLILQRVRIKALPEKYEILNAPIKFTIENEFYKLRGEPKIDNTGTFIYDYPNQGNTLAIFKKGLKGKVWAKDNSDPDREWWYVEMEPTNEKLEFDMFSYFDNKKQLRRMGWMSSRFLKTIE